MLRTTEAFLVLVVGKVGVLFRLVRTKGIEDSWARLLCFYKEIY